MDGLIIVLAIIGFIIKASNKNKKKAQKGEAARPAPAQAPSAPKKGAETLDRWLKEAMDEIDSDLDLDALDKGVDAIQAAVTKASKPKTKPAQPKAKPVPKQLSMEELAAKAALRAHAAERIPCHEHEGLHATQGETAEEHAEHLRRIREIEEAERSTLEETASLRNLNLQRLRDAVVMSEVLGKPVALRQGRR